MLRTLDSVTSDGSRETGFQRRAGVLSRYGAVLHFHPTLRQSLTNVLWLINLGSHVPIVVRS